MLRHALPPMILAAAALTLAIPARAEVGTSPPAAPAQAALPPSAHAALPPSAQAAPPSYAPPGTPLPGNYDAPSRSELPPEDPPSPGPRTKRRSVPMMVSGGVLAAAGLALNAAAAYYLLATLAYRVDGQSKYAGTGLGLFAGGVVSIAIGVPLLVVGAQRRKSSERWAAPLGSAWIGAPGGAGWMWRF